MSKTKQRILENREGKTRATATMLAPVVFSSKILLGRLLVYFSLSWSPQTCLCLRSVWQLTPKTLLLQALTTKVLRHSAHPVRLGRYELTYCPQPPVPTNDYCFRECVCV